MSRGTAVYELYMMRGPSPGKVFPLADKNLTIGRDPISDIAISDPEVSRQHALLISAADGYQIQDLGSTNGTYVDGVRLGSVALKLRPSDAITMGGSVTLIFQERTIDEQVESESGGSASVTYEDISPAAAPADEEQPQKKQPSARELPVGRPRMEHKRPISIDAERAPSSASPAAVPEAAQVKPQETKELSPNVILGLVLLLLCSCATVLVFLAYLRGDWFLRQIGIVP